MNYLFRDNARCGGCFFRYLRLRVRFGLGRPTFAEIVANRTDAPCVGCGN